MARIWDSDSDKENCETVKQAPKKKTQTKQKPTKVQKKLTIKSPLPGLDSLYSVAIILSFFGYQDKVQSMLNLLCITT